LIHASNHNHNNHNNKNNHNGAGIRGNNTNINAYKALGVSPTATQEDIKKAYRSLCLKYHPDKHINKSNSEQERNEQLFKDVQEANSLIGTTEARRKYDALQSIMSSSFRRYSSFSSSSYYNDAADHHYHPFTTFGFGSTPSSSSTPPQTSFYVNGIDLSHLFTATQSRRRHHTTTNHSSQDTTTTIPQQQQPYSNPKSTFIQKVQIPLHELYTGVQRKPLYLHNTLWTRYLAAFRGGMAIPIAIQSFFTSLPLLFRTTSPIIFLASFVLFFHWNIPHPTKTIFYVSILKGWKQGTKLKFSSMGGNMEYIFVIEEGPHPSQQKSQHEEKKKHSKYTRIGDDLHTHITITKQMAQDGGTIWIDSLVEAEAPIQMNLKPGEIVEMEQQIVMKGKGWPKSDGSLVGDLIVTVSVVPGGGRSGNRNRNRNRNSRNRSKSRSGRRGLFGIPTDRQRMDSKQKNKGI
jgi:DnaJ-class molecular chaperone